MRFLQRRDLHRVYRFLPSWPVGRQSSFGATPSVLSPQREAEAYGPSSAKWQRARGLELMSLLELRAKQRVVDLGCGSGELTVELARRVGLQGRAVGLDPNKDRIRVAQERYGDPSNLEFAVGTNDDVEKYRPLDRVFSSFVIYWIRDQSKCFRQIFNALRPGGLFGLIGVTEPPLFLHKLTKVMAGPDVHLNELMNWHFRTLDGWNNLGEETGFSVRHSDEYFAYNSHPTLEHLLTWWEASTSGQCLVENTVEEDLNRVLQEFNLDRNQTIEFKETIIRTILQKPF